MMKRIFYHSILSLLLLVVFCITGGGNLAKAQSYQLVTSKDGLVSGDKYLIVAKDYSMALGTTRGNNRAAVDVDIETDGNNISTISTVPSGACVLELKAQDGGKWAFYDAFYVASDASKGGYLYAASSNSNHLKTQTKLDNNCKATVDITSDGVATIKFQGKYTHNWLRFNDTNNPPIFSCYTKDQQDVYLYHYVAPTGTTDPELSYSPSTFTIAANGTLTQPELKNLNGVTIKSYSSSNPSVATVTDKGVIALAGRTGTATITATSQANDTYKVGTATYMLTVFGAPEITPQSGEYENNVTVVMNATGAGALFYTTDGTDPKDAIDAATKVTEFPYNLPLSVGTHTIKAVTADKNLDVYSDVLTRTYTVVLAVPTPQLSQAAGNYNYEVAVDVTVANSGGAVGYVYTTDGSDPANSGTATTVNALTGTVTLYKGEHTLTVKSFTAEKANFSDAATAAYTVALPQPVITLSAESTQEQPITVTIEAEGAPYIWYTTDGTDPLASGVTPVQVEGSSTSFTFTEAGTYTITAVGVNNNAETSDAATTTCTISKIIPVPGSATMKYKKVTSMDDIVDGGVYIVVCESQNVAMSEVVTSSTRAEKADVVWGANNTYEGAVNGETLPYELQLNKIEEGKYSIYVVNQESYLTGTSKTSKAMTLTTTIHSDLARWSVTFSAEGNVLIDCLGTSNYCLNYNSSSKMFRPYPSSSNQMAVQLYKKTFDLSVNANTAGYATAYTAFPYVMPASADGYIVTETAEGETIKAKNKYPAGAEVPAYAPLLIKNSEAGVKLNPVVLGKTVEAYPYAEENLLHGTRLESDGVTTDVDGTNNYYYYKLSYKLDAEKNPVPDSYGFYRGKADGGAFEIKNTLTAYLALPRSSGLVNNLRISIDNEDGPATSIQTNRLPADNMPQSIYTLSGVRVNAAGGSLPKGIYIVNGKKVVIK